MSLIRLEYDNVKPFVSDDDIARMQPEISRIDEMLESGRTPGNDSLGWLHLPSTSPLKLTNKINETAQEIRERSDIFIVIGIGGSYLGARSAIEFMSPTFGNLLAATSSDSPEIYFAGHNLSSDYLSDLIDIAGEKRVTLNVISKSGTTTEPAVAFRVLYEPLRKRYGKDELKKRIIVTTDREKGALRQLAESEGMATFVIPDDIGGRYSVLTPVGLLPMAVAGIDIERVIRGAKRYEDKTSSPLLESNEAYMYAAIRNILYLKGKGVEILSTFHPALHYIAEWWKQLSGESEGKDQRGIYPASVDLTTDLHSMGQWIQEGSRIIFETFMAVNKSNRQILIPEREDDKDGLNYIAGRSLDFVNEKAYQGTAAAHHDGGVPNMRLILEERSEETLGGLYYFLERAIAMSGSLLRVNPFNQPGVEFYKNNMFKLLGRPGF